MKTKRYQLVFFGFFILTSSFIDAESILYGGDAGWSRTISSGLHETPGWRGKNALTLSPRGRNPFTSGGGDTNPIDILLLSAPEGLENPAAHYRIEGDYTISHDAPARSNTSIRFGTGGLKLYPSQSSLWSPGEKWGDFTLGFFLKPTSLRDGEVFFSWEGRDASGETQFVTARVKKRRLVWEFHRFFRLGIKRSLILTLVSSPLIPGEWQHHRIRFEFDALPPEKTGASPGYLEYRVDNIPVDAVHTTQNGREGMEVFAPHIGILSDKPLLLAPKFNGYIDEFQLTSEAVTQPLIGRYINREASVYGTGRTDTINAGYPGSALWGIRARIDAPGLTQIKFFAQAFDTLSKIFAVNHPDPNHPNWVELTLEEQSEDPMGFGRWFLGVPNKPINGRYFVIGYVLYSDNTSDIAPVLSTLEVHYTPRLPPHPPRNITYTRGLNDQSIISWNPATEEDIAGWWVLWGPRPNDYIPDGSDDDLHGMAWVPKIPGDVNRPQFSAWPEKLKNRIVYAIVRTAWAEGAPGESLSALPLHDDALSLPSSELHFRP